VIKGKRTYKPGAGLGQPLFSFLAFFIIPTGQPNRDPVFFKPEQQGSFSLIFLDKFNLVDTFDSNLKRPLSLAIL